MTQLVRGQRPIEPLVHELAGFGWACEAVLVTLAREDIARQLLRLVAGEATVEEVVLWAKAVDAREDIDLESSHESLIQSTLVSLIVGGFPGDGRDLTIEKAHRLLRLLSVSKQ